VWGIPPQEESEGGRERVLYGPPAQGAISPWINASNGKTLQGEYYTHPYIPGYIGEEFSSQDMSNSNSFNVPSYIAPPPAVPSRSTVLEREFLAPKDGIEACNCYSTGLQQNGHIMSYRLRFRMKSIAIAVLTSFLLSGICVAQSRQSYKPKGGFVPNQETAIRIAEAIWIPIYGAEEINREKPFIASLKNGVWFVHGSLPKGYNGGVAEAEIAKADGRIIRVIHGQ